MMLSNNKLVLIFCAFVLSQQPPVIEGVEYRSSEYESRIHKDILNGYEKDVHPVMENNSSRVILVTFDVQLIRILEINERSQLIKVYFWVNQYWNNPLLGWNPADYHNITSIYVAPGKVWVPDIVLYNSVDDNGQFSGGGSDIYRHKIHIKHDGSHSWLNPVQFQSICVIDVSYFPFDDQKCQLKFGSWAHDSSMIDLAPPKNLSTQNSYYIKNGEWELLGLQIQRNALKYQCCKMPFIDLTMTINVRRQAISYQMTLIIPCALLSSLVYLGFILPPESGERVGLSITVLLAVTVFQEMTSRMMPTFDFPFLAQYYLGTIFQTAFSLIVTTVILNVYHRSEREMPRIVKIILLKWMHPMLFCIGKKPENERKVSNCQIPYQKPGFKSRKVSSQEPSCKDQKQAVKSMFQDEDEKRSLKEDFNVIKSQVNQIRKLSQQHTYNEENVNCQASGVTIAITEPDGKRHSVVQDQDWSFTFERDQPETSFKSCSSPDISERPLNNNSNRLSCNIECERSLNPSKQANSFDCNQPDNQFLTTFKAVDPKENKRSFNSWFGRAKKNFMSKTNSETQFAIGESLRSSAFVLLGEKAAEQTNKQYVKKTTEEREKIKKQRQREWYVAARVLDRFFLILFIITSNTMIFVIFFRAPRFGLIG